MFGGSEPSCLHLNFCSHSSVSKVVKIVSYNLRRTMIDGILKYMFACESIPISCGIIVLHFSNVFWTSRKKIIIVKLNTKNLENDVSL